MLDIKKYQAILEKQQEEIATRVEKIRRDLNHVERPVSKTFSDQAIELGNTDVLGSLLQEGESELVDIRTALARISDGSYGSCRSCSEDIAEERLQALPYTSVCKNCAE